SKLSQNYFNKKKLFFKKITNNFNIIFQKFSFFKKRIAIIFGLRRKKGRPKKTKTILGRSQIFWNGFFAIFFTVFILTSSWISYEYVFKGLPSVLDLVQKKPLQTTRILDRNGKVLFRI